MNLPNFLTGSRFVVIPIFGWCLYKEYYLLAIILFLLAGVTDIFDGYFARKYNIVTTWGKFADPIADKCMLITALLILTYQGKVPDVIVGIIFVKELLIGIGSILLYKKNKFVVSSNKYGKMSTVIFYIALSPIIIFESQEIFSKVFVWIALISAIYAFYTYIKLYINIRKNNG